MMVSVFDVIGPAMIGPSSSHTAGAVRIGLAARGVLDAEPVKALVELHGSFAATGKGHATDRALVAGLLGFSPDDERLEHSLRLAEAEELVVEFRETDLGEETHPNAARITLESADGERHVIVGWSVGGGAVQIREIDGFATRISGDLETVIIWNQDQPGFLAKVATLYECSGNNIATVLLSRASRGQDALMAIESDAPLPPEAVAMIRRLPDTSRVCEIPRDWKLSEKETVRL